jgi:Mg/Co/Ni transporter MgtE
MRLLALVGVVWGGFIIRNYFMKSHGTGAYANGQMLALITGFLMFVAGLFALLKGSTNRG